jgi:tetratricopeptide (TPR) repeat protein
MPKHPPYPAPPGQPSASDQVLQGAILALQMQRPDEAERLAGGVLKANRGNAAAAAILGRALMLQNRAAEAIIPLERAARRGDNPALETQLAAALAAAGRRDQALEQLRRTTARRPPFLPAFLEHAGQHAKSGNYAEAIAVLEGGLALLPGALELQVELAFLHVKRNDRAKARLILSQALAAAPQHPHVLAALAQVMHLDGDYAAAADTYRRALALRPDDAAARKNLGACLLEMGEREAGEASMRTAIRAAPQLTGPAIISLAAASYGRFFLRPSAAANFLHGNKG